MLQPFTGTDVAAIVLAVLAALYAALWLRDRERGMPWLAFSFGMAAIWFAANERHLPVGPRIESAHGWAMLILASTMTMTVGVVRYLGPLKRLHYRMLGVLLVPGVVLMVAMALQAPVPRPLANATALLGYLGSGAMALRAARSEPGAGHAFIGLALLAIPGCLVAVLWLDAPIRQLRFWAALPLLFFGLTLLTVSLLRRRRALEAEVQRRAAAEAELKRVNATLEQRVNERTSDLQQLVDGLESFNRSVSHDLRGPLSGIEGLAQLAQDAYERGDDSVARRALPAIAGQAQSLRKLVGALLELARVGDATVRCEQVDLGAMVQDVIGQVRLAVSGATASAIQVGPLRPVHADPDLLRPVLVNLIGNALKFSGTTPDARVEVSSRDEAGGVVVCVSDNGVGFEPAQAAALFQPFRRLHGARFEGSGVGLSIVRRAVERHGGRVWATAAPGRGASFCFLLPGPG